MLNVSYFAPFQRDVFEMQSSARKYWDVSKCLRLKQLLWTSLCEYVHSP